MLWVAEVGSAHKGNQSLAYEYIRAFAAAGANIIKFQFGWTMEAQLAQGLEYMPLRYVDAWAGDLKRWCDYHGVELMASIWSFDGLEAARAVGMKLYKIGARMKNQALIDAIYDVAGSPADVYHSGVNVWCKSKYPAYPDELDMPLTLSGYSDHTHGIEACLLAVARGAVYIEKHVCLDKSDLVTRDTPFSATPDEFTQMVRLGNGMRRLLDAKA